MRALCTALIKLRRFAKRWQGTKSRSQRSVSVDGLVLSTEVRTKTGKDLIFANRNDRGAHRNISVKYLLSVWMEGCLKFSKFSSKRCSRLFTFFRKTIRCPQNFRNWCAHFIMSHNFRTVFFICSLKFSSEVIIPKAAKSVRERSSGTYMNRMNNNRTS